jgi:hypothetical protein
VWGPTGGPARRLPSSGSPPRPARVRTGACPPRWHDLLLVGRRPACRAPRLYVAEFMVRCLVEEVLAQACLGGDIVIVSGLPVRQSLPSLLPVPPPSEGMALGRHGRRRGCWDGSRPATVTPADPPRPRPFPPPRGPRGGHSPRPPRCRKVRWRRASTSSRSRACARTVRYPGRHACRRQGPALWSPMSMGRSTSSRTAAATVAPTLSHRCPSGCSSSPAPGTKGWANSSRCAGTSRPSKRAGRSPTTRRYEVRSWRPAPAAPPPPAHRLSNAEDTEKFKPSVDAAFRQLLGAYARGEKF